MFTFNLSDGYTTVVNTWTPAQINSFHSVPLQIIPATDINTSIQLDVSRCYATANYDGTFYDYSNIYFKIGSLLIANSPAPFLSGVPGKYLTYFEIGGGSLLEVTTGVGAFFTGDADSGLGNGTFPITTYFTYKLVGI